MDHRQRIENEFLELVSEYEQNPKIISLFWMMELDSLIKQCQEHQQVGLEKTIEDFLNDMHVLYRAMLLEQQIDYDSDDDSEDHDSGDDSQNENQVQSMTRDDLLEESRQRMEQELHDRLARANIYEEHALRLQERMNPIEFAAPLKTLDPSLIAFIKEKETYGSCDCSICLESANPSVQLQCGHGYHASCIIAWIQRDYSCPFCRQSFAL